MHVQTSTDVIRQSLTTGETHTIRPKIKDRKICTQLQRAIEKCIMRADDRREGGLQDQERDFDRILFIAFDLSLFSCPPHHRDVHHHHQGHALKHKHRHDKNNKVFLNRIITSSR